MSGVTFFLYFLGGITLLDLLVARWRRPVALLWLLTALAALSVMNRWPTDRPVLVLGREVWLARPVVWHMLRFQVDDLARQVGRMFWLSVALWSGVSLLVPRWGEGMGWLPVVVIPAVPALFIQSLWGLGWAMTLWLAGVLLLVYGGRRGEARGTWQWMFPLVPTSLALFLLLLPLDPNTNAVPPWHASILALFLLVLAGQVPLHTGLVALAPAGRPIGVAWAWWVHTLVVLLALARVGMHPSVAAAQWRIHPFLEFLAYATLIWGGLGALSANQLRQMWGYAVLYNWGLTFSLWLLAPTSPGTWQWTLAVRWLALGVTAFALTTLLADGDGGHLARISGWARRRPWAVTAWVVGMATLSGVPFTPGFWTQWLIHVHTVNSSPLSWLSLAGGMGVAIGLMRALVALWGPLKDRLLIREERGEAILLSVLALILIGGAFFPRWMTALGRILW